MTRDDIIKLAREAGLKVGENISGVTLIGSPLPMGLAHIDLDEMQRFASLVAAAEREACAEAVAIALLGADRALADRALKAISGRGNL